MGPVAIIPAYNPDEKLIGLAAGLKKAGLRTLVIDDGSREAYRGVFDTLERKGLCPVVRHESNRGKGAALRTGLREAARLWPDADGFVTADADGQHSPEDILRVASLLRDHPDSLILGRRDFGHSGVPLRSMLGNRITSVVYLLSTGRWCADTQTGLRGIPAELLDTCLGVKGDRYEYEMNLLLALGKSGVPFVGVPIETIYIDSNRSSHFDPLRDSAMIYVNIIKFSLSSLLAAAADLTLFTVFVHLVFGGGALGILASTAAARLLSGTLNFAVNRSWVFRSGGGGEQAAKYFLLFFCQMAASWLAVTALSHVASSLTLAKLLVDAGLFLISYQIQKRAVFTGGGKEAK